MIGSRNKRGRDDFSDYEVAAHTIRFDRLQLALFGLRIPLRTLILALAVLLPAHFGWSVGEETGAGVVGGTLSAMACTAATILLLEKIATPAGFVPLSLLPRRRRLEGRRIELCLDRAYFYRTIEEINRRLVLIEYGSPEWRRLDDELDRRKETVWEIDRELDRLERELTARYEDWRAFFRPGGGPTLAARS